MKYITQLSFLILIHFTFLSRGQNTQALKYDASTFPKYEEVLNTFFDSGKSPRYPEQDKYYLSFAKKPDGWYVIHNDRLTGKQQDAYLFWSLEKKEYVEDAKKRTKVVNSPNIVQKFLRRDSNKSFEYSLFYGYPEWADDVIKELEGRKELIDVFWYSLGYAYSYKADIALGNYVYGLNEVKKIESNEKKAREYFQKSIKAYERLQKQNPDYKAFIGNISLKTAHQYLTAFYSLETRGFTEEAKSFLKANIYDDFYMSFAKNMLNSCPKNAILFTGGDTDTYPLLYVQNQLGHRTDVQIINLSLLATDWYIRYQKQNLGKLNINNKTYEDRMMDVIILQNSPDKIFDFKTVAKILNDKDEKAITTLGNNQYYQIQTPRFKVTDSLILNYGKQSYLYKNDIALIDVVASFIQKRPICFGNTTAFQFRAAFKTNLSKEGLVIKVTENSQEKDINITQTQKLLDKLIIKGVNQNIQNRLIGDSGKVFYMIFKYLIIKCLDI